MNYQRAVNVSRLVLVLLCIALLLSIAVFGFNIGGKSMNGIFEKDTIRLGLDLAGGSVITYQAQTDDAGTALSSGMQSILQVMRMRLDNLGLTEAQVYLVGDDMITVEIPSITNPTEAAETLMATAVLTFRNADGEVVLEGADVKSARASYGVIDDDKTYKYHVQLSLNDVGTSKFTAATKAAANAATADKQKILIYMDDTLISSPSVDPKQYAATGITGGDVIISGNFTEESSKILAGQINAGALKYALDDVDQRTVGATLGEKSLTTSLKAGAIGILFVMVFMIIYYRVPGAVASISLIAYMSIFMLALVLLKANLTLPGIAGIILSIGMAVDANVVIFERTKEELRLGKSAKAAVKGGYSRALSAVIDSNITTLIAAGVLYFLGSGTIKGFATTLLIGIVISLFTAIFLTRALLHLSIGMGLSSTRLYGVKERSEQNA
ncbi:MAG: protein translocase subunit SecD [Firmicutes bacterium HGW-Firmicutes-21]|nr:MAG: protein translocase subunit SecD [Firmicutes bacterium HGW-Firmicutes-21]